MKRISRIPARPLTRFKKKIKAATPFVLTCGIIAFVYFLYRTVLLAVPVVSIEQSIVNPHGDASIVCGQEEGDTQKDPAPVFSSSYQKRIQSAPALGSNLVRNATFDMIDDETGQPVGYSHTLEDPSTTYSVPADEEGMVFLRVQSSTKSVVMPAWQMDSVPVTANTSYGYSFLYRASSPVDLTIVTSTSDQLDYSYVATLPASRGWISFTGEYTNMDHTTDMQIVVSGTDAGFVDTRGYDIHQIPAANLVHGIVSVTFDDGWQSTYKKARPILQKYAIPTTQYIIADVAAHNVVEYMNFNEIKQLHNDGHEIGSHSLTHCNQVVLDAQSLDDNALRSKTILEAQVGTIKSFAYPLGQYNDLTQKSYQRYYPLIRTSDVGFNNRYFDEANIHSMAILNTTTDTELGSWISYAKKHGLWLVLAYHRVDASGEYNVSSAVLEKQLAQIKASGLRVLTVSDAAASIRP